MKAEQTVITGMTSNASGDGANYWDKISRQWEHIVPPLKPTEDDLAAYAAAIAEWNDEYGRPLRALILGATPQLYHLPWPEGTDLLAVDKSQSILENVWPGVPGTALCADWTTMDLPAASRNIVLGDGVMTFFTKAECQRLVMERLRSIVVPGGIVILRLFVPPVRQESRSLVLSDLAAGRIGNLSQLKLRLWMALLDKPEDGVRLGDVWDAVHSVALDQAAFADAIGWPREHFAAINSYRNSSERYWFFSLEEARNLLAGSGSGFEWRAAHVPSYPLGECCPTIILRHVG
jgi:hypothetical protein